MKKIIVSFCLLVTASLFAQEKFKTGPFAGYSLDDRCVYNQFYPQYANPQTPQEGDLVRLTLRYKNSKDSLLFDSNTSLDSLKYIEFILGPSAFKGSFEDGLKMMRVGDTASFLINVDSLFLRSFAASVPEFIEKGSMLNFQTRLLKITAKEDLDKQDTLMHQKERLQTRVNKLKEIVDLHEYLEKNNISSKPTASGLYYVEKVKGKGAAIPPGSSVKMNYTLRLLNGTLFDTNDSILAKKEGIHNPGREYSPFAFTLGQNMVIPGFEEGVARMKKGGKSQIILPSSIGYGEMGSGGIPPYTTLVFDIELINFTPPEKQKK